MSGVIIYRPIGWIAVKGELRHQEQYTRRHYGASSAYKCIRMNIFEFRDQDAGKAMQDGDEPSSLDTARGLTGSRLMRLRMMCLRAAK
jgi:hypothetical protein